MPRAIFILLIFLVVLILACGHSSQSPDPNSSGNFTLHSFQRIQLTDTFFSEGVATGDINRDGFIDIVAGPYWYAGPMFQEKHSYYQPAAFDPLGYSNNFLTFVYDFNGDGWPDILVINFPGLDASWYENPKGKDVLWVKHQVIDSVASESPNFVDLNNDGIPELVYISNDGRLGWSGPDPADPAKPWLFHPLSAPGYRAAPHGLGVGDVNGDGRMDILEANGWWEQPPILVGDPVWVFHPYPFGSGTQMYAVDVDGDGLNDVVTSLNAHGYGLAWYQQVRQGGEITFCKHLILNDSADPNRYGVAFSQLHAVAVADIDGDGLPDIVTGKRHWAHGPTGDVDPNGPSVLYWFRNTRTVHGVDFVPYLVDSNSGVGTQVYASDINGDTLPDIVISNKLGTFLMRHTANSVSKQQGQAAQPKPQVPLDSSCHP